MRSIDSVHPGFGGLCLETAGNNTQNGKGWDRAFPAGFYHTQDIRPTDQDEAVWLNGDQT